MLSFGLVAYVVIGVVTAAAVPSGWMIWGVIGPLVFVNAAGLLGVWL